MFNAAHWRADAVSVSLYGSDRKKGSVLRAILARLLVELC
jgi:hypothetical protein